MLGCFVEIPYIKEKEYEITVRGKTRVQSINGIPVTNDMLSIIKDMNAFDFIIICMSCIDVPSRDKDTICYCFSPGCVESGVREQNSIRAEREKKGNARLFLLRAYGDKLYGRLIQIGECDHQHRIA